MSFKSYQVIQVQSIGLNTAPASPTATNTWISGDNPDGDWGSYPPHALQQWMPDFPGWNWRLPERGEMFHDWENNTLVVFDGTIFRSVGQMPIIPPKADRITYPEMFAARTTVATSAGSSAINYVPVRFDRQLSITKLHCDVAATTASGEFRLAIYRDSSGTPTDLITESAGLDAATATGTKTWTLSSALTVYPRRYWFAMRANNASATFTGIAAAGMATVFGNADTAGTLGNAQTAMTETGTYGAFPATATVGGYTANAIPIIGYEIGPE